MRLRLLGILPLLAVVAASWALFVWAHDGFLVEIGGLRVSSRSPDRALIVALLLLGIHAWLAGVRATRDRLAIVLRRFKPSYVAGGLALLASLAGFVHNSAVGGGSDSYGYVSQVDLWLRGELVTRVPAASEVPWPNGLATLTPLGYRPVNRASAIAPTYSPGLPLLMAVMKLVAGHCAMFLVVPLAGGLIVLLTFAIGRQLASDEIGLAAAWLVATSPALLFMMMSPMSDVPAAGAWVLTTYLVLRGSLLSAMLAGLSASIAILIRPNLAPIAAVFPLWLAWIDWTDRRSWTSLVRPAAFSAAVVPGCLAVAAINKTLYGSPFESGYGRLSDLFALAHVPVNVRQYGAWFIETQTAIGIFGLLILFVPLISVWRTPQARRVAALLALVAFVAIGSYLIYLPWDAWWYLRFLLPAWPAIFIGTAFLIWRVAQLSPWPQVRPLWAVVVFALGVHGLGLARDRSVYRIGDGERRYVTTATLVRKYTDPSSIILAHQHSGTIRYYGNRHTVRFDILEPAWVDRAVDWFAARGLHPYVVLEEWEVPMFTQRFAGTDAGALEMAPVFIFLENSPLYLYDLLATDTGKDDPQPLKNVPVPPFCAIPEPVGELILKKVEGRR